MAKARGRCGGEDVAVESMPKPEDISQVESFATTEGKAMLFGSEFDKAWEGSSCDDEDWQLLRLSGNVAATRKAMTRVPIWSQIVGDLLQKVSLHEMSGDAAPCPWVFFLSVVMANAGNVLGGVEALGCMGRHGVKLDRANVRALQGRLVNFHIHKWMFDVPLHHFFLDKSAYRGKVQVVDLLPFVLPKWNLDECNAAPGVGQAKMSLEQVTFAPALRVAFLLLAPSTTAVVVDTSAMCSLATAAYITGCAPVALTSLEAYMKEFCSSSSNPKTRRCAEGGPTVKVHTLLPHPLRRCPRKLVIGYGRTTDCYVCPETGERSDTGNKLHTLHVMTHGWGGCFVFLGLPVADGGGVNGKVGRQKDLGEYSARACDAREARVRAGAELLQLPADAYMRATRDVYTDMSLVVTTRVCDPAQLAWRLWTFWSPSVEPPWQVRHITLSRASLTPHPYPPDVMEEAGYGEGRFSTPPPNWTREDGVCLPTSVEEVQALYDWHRNSCVSGALKDLVRGTPPPNPDGGKRNQRGP